MDFAAFQNPPTLLRPAPFWSINDRITPGETARQLRDMIAKGLGGAFFHSRSGLITDYLGDEWFAAMDAALEVAETDDGYLWLYDEDQWPSGNAGGQVAALGDSFRAAMLQPEYLGAGEAADPDLDGEPLAAFEIAGREGNTIMGARRIPFVDAAAPGQRERLLFRRVYDPKSSWWSGESYSNLLNPDVTKRFIELTHDVYKARLGKHFGKRIPGIFTDEPMLLSSDRFLPWFDSMPVAYSMSTGRDFWCDVPYLFLDGPECGLIRQSVHRVWNTTFAEHYSRPIFEWCNANGLEHTGHYMNEDSFHAQLKSHCGSVMTHYRYEHVPGLDHLCRRADNMLITVKQVSSAARQLGRRGVLTEIFGVSHHTNTFADFKWLGDYDLVLGATFFCPHLSWYGMRGKRKRDYPPNWNYQQTYWPHVKPLNDYFSRAAVLLTSGKARVDVLFLSPIEAAGATYRRSPIGYGRHPVPAGLSGGDINGVVGIDTYYQTLLAACLAAGHDADVGDEGYIQDMGNALGGRFIIGEMAYPVVVLPEAPTWRHKTVAFLEHFVRQGGHLIVAGRPPTEVDCLPAPDRWAAILAAPNVRVVPAGVKEIQAALDAVVPNTHRLRDQAGRPVSNAYMQVRDIDGMTCYFVVNSHREETRHLRLTVRGAAALPVAEWDALSGERRAVLARQNVGDDMLVHLELPPCGSIFLLVGDNAAPALPVATPPNLLRGTITPLPTIWTQRRSEPNVLVIDRLAYSLDGGATFSAEMTEIEAQRELAAHFDVSQSLGWQPWVSIRKQLFDGRGGPVVLRYRVHNTLPARAPAVASFVLEDLFETRLTVNGVAIDLAAVLAQAGAAADGSTGERPWHWDRGFGKVDIAAHLQPGWNIIDAAFDYTHLSHVERAYLVGDFGVRLMASRDTGELIDEPASLTTGSWLEQGYPFYPGAMRYGTTLPLAPRSGRLSLRLLGLSAVLVRVHVNGKPAVDLLWQPFVADLTPYLTSGGGDYLEIEVVGSNQNTHGPLHVRRGDDLGWVGPNAFDNASQQRQAFSLYDYGLLGGAELVWTSGE